ncbi:uncharacterized protein [Pagrus major]|uniref:uncharacterized protein isoform X1 n=1 Tax=Pagrus major TaxID=143350 RepID=UPI003CC8DF76
MVSACIVPKCKAVKWKRGAGVSYYRLPLKDPERCRQWLRAVNNPKYGESSAMETLHNLRVCSLHFKAEDLERNVLDKAEGYVYGKRLKNTAVPSVNLDGEKPAASAQPKRRRVGLKQQDTLETDKPPGQIGDTVSDVVQPGEDSLFESTYNTPETSTATMEKAPLQHIVDEEAILQLMKNCPMCDRKCRCTKHNRGPYFIVYQSCYFCHYQRKWASQPEALNMNINKAHTAPKRKHQPKEKVCVNTKAQS